MARRSGRGVTPENLVNVLRDAVDKSSQMEMSKILGVGVASINRYINGFGEPTQETFEKLANYFKVSVPWLRGEYEWSYDKEKIRFNGEIKTRQRMVDHTRLLETHLLYLFYEVVPDRCKEEFVEEVEEIAFVKLEKENELKAKLAASSPDPQKDDFQ